MLLRSAVAILFLSATSALAGYLDGADINRECEKQNSIFLLGYVTGAHDAYEVADTVEGASRVCLPSTASSGQLAAILCKYVKDNPEMWTWTASALLYNAELKAFPCQ